MSKYPGLVGDIWMCDTSWVGVDPHSDKLTHRSQESHCPHHLGSQSSRNHVFSLMWELVNNDGFLNPFIHLFEISVALMDGLPCQHTGELAVNCVRVSSG